MFTRRDASTPAQPARDEPLHRTEPQPATPIPSTPTTTPTAAAQPAMGAPAESLIAQDDTFEGQLKTTNGVRVLGTVRGGIESERSVRVESGAHVEADITAEEVVIAGTYSGNLTCRNRVEITSTGRVSGKLDTVKLFLHEGGFFDGELHMQRPSDEAPRPTETEGIRPRRARYVDVAGDASQPAAASASEPGKTGEPTTP